MNVHLWLLLYACSGALASVKLLLKNDPLLQMKNGGNVLQFAIEKNRRSIIKEFLALPCDITTELIKACNNEGMNALHYAINNHLEVAQEIIMKKKSLLLL